MNRLLISIFIVWAMFSPTGCGDGPGYVSASIPNNYTDANSSDTGVEEATVATQFVCPSMYQSCGSPVVLCCAENNFHCELSGSNYTCVSGAFVEPCDANCKSLSDAEAE